MTSSKTTTFPPPLLRYDFGGSVLLSCFPHSLSKLIMSCVGENEVSVRTRLEQRRALLSHLSAVTDFRHLILNGCATSHNFTVTVICCFILYSCRDVQVKK